MIDEDFDVKSTYYEAALYEADIIQLWDGLPDYCKTARLWEKVKEMASPSFAENRGVCRRHTD
jgi:hypothetical protein